MTRHLWSFLLRRWRTVVVSLLVLQSIVCFYMMLGVARDLRRAKQECQMAMCHTKTPGLLAGPGAVPGPADADTSSSSATMQERNSDLLRSVAMVYPKGYASRGTRSGCFITSAGLLLTSAIWPPLDCTTSCTVHATYEDGKWFQVPYEVARMDRTKGIALLKPTKPLESQVRPMPVRRIRDHWSTTLTISYMRRFPKSEDLAKMDIRSDTDYKTMVRTRVSAHLPWEYYCVQDPVSFTARGAPVSDKEGYLVGMCMGYVPDERTSRSLTVVRAIEEKDVHLPEGGSGQ
jgi:hypothetical protein